MRTLAAAVSVALALFAAGCGSEEASTDETRPSSPTTATLAPASRPVEAPASKPAAPSQGAPKPPAGTQPGTQAPTTNPAPGGDTDFGGTCEGEEVCPVG